MDFHDFYKIFWVIWLLKTHFHQEDLLGEVSGKFLGQWAFYTCLFPNGYSEFSNVPTFIEDHVKYVFRFNRLIITQKMKFSITDFFSKCDQICKFPEDLVTFTEEILNGKFHFLCSE